MNLANIPIPIIFLDPITAHIAFYAVLAVAAVVAAIFIYTRVKWRYWLRLAGKRLVAVAVGRDKIARLIVPKTVAGQFLDLGDYGKIQVSPKAVYPVMGSPNGQHMVVVYIPYAMNMDVEKVAATNVIEDWKRGELNSNDSGNEVEVERHT
ncbi:hypothetical protein DRJ19_05565, partial [Candidatus Woesearchaeota archaeon]